MNAQERAFEKRLSRVEALLGASVQRLDRFESLILVHEKRQQTTIDHLQERVDDLSRLMHLVIRELRHLKGEVDEVEEDVDELEEDVDAIERKLRRMRRHHYPATSRISVSPV